MEKLVKKAKKGDAEAFIALMEQNRQSMIRIAFAYLGNEEDVADAMQETILSAFEKLDTLRRAEYFRTWLIRILINQCIAMRRHRSRTVPMNGAEEASQFYDFSTDLEFNDLLKTLPEDSRLIFQMYYGEQFSIGEIAQLLHMKENTVKSKIHRGREQLRSQMGVGKENSHDKQSVDWQKNRGNIRNYQRNIRKEKKTEAKKKVRADGGCSCSDCCSYWILCGKSGLGKRTASDRQRDRTGTGAAGVPGDTDRRNCNAGTNRARNIQCRGERRGWGQQYRSHWDPEYGNQCGSYRTGAVSGIGSGLHHYLDGLLCHKPGNFPGGKNGERGRISGDVSE